MKINRHILDNGLRLVHSQDESTQMVALNVLYNVGARDEHPEHQADEDPTVLWGHAVRDGGRLCRGVRAHAVGSHRASSVSLS